MTANGLVLTYLKRGLQARSHFSLSLKNSRLVKDALRHRSLNICRHLGRFLEDSLQLG
jgi:hypothetical protein